MSEDGYADVVGVIEVNGIPRGTWCATRLADRCRYCDSRVWAYEVWTAEGQVDSGRIHHDDSDDPFGLAGKVLSR